jgi:hypothetical protein
LAFASHWSATFGSGCYFSKSLPNTNEKETGVAKFILPHQFCSLEGVVQ